MRHVLLQTTYLTSWIRRYSLHGIDFSQYLTDDHLQKCITKFARVRRHKEFKNLKKEASVLIPLCVVNDEVGILYTLRTANLSRHRGQISFPGGIRDSGESAVDAAIRETEEEIGIQKSSIKVYGCGAPVARLEILITPVVGFLGSLVPSNLNINRREVQHAFVLPLAKFCDLNNCGYTNFGNKYTLPVFVINGYRVWGITAYLTHVFLKCFLENDYKFMLKV